MTSADRPREDQVEGTKPQKDHNERMTRFCSIGSSLEDQRPLLHLLFSNLPEHTSLGMLLSSNPRDKQRHCFGRRMPPGMVETRTNGHGGTLCPGVSADILPKNRQHSWGRWRGSQGIGMRDPRRPVVVIGPFHEQLHGTWLRRKLARTHSATVQPMTRRYLQTTRL